MSREKFIEHTLSEHLKSYILLAYDYDGNHVGISNIKTQEEFDALHNALTRKEIEFSSNLNIFYDDEDGEIIN